MRKGQNTPDIQLTEILKKKTNVKEQNTKVILEESSPQEDL